MNKDTNLRKSIATIALVFSLLLSGYAAAETLVQIRLVDPLDEPEFYCLDLSGWGDHLKLEDPLQAHTCKTRGAGDQMFSVEDGKILVGDTGRCLQVASSGKALAGSAILARACSDSAMQAFTLEEDGRISVTGSDLCIAAGDESTDASGPSHVWRVLSAEHCDSVSAELMTWQMGL
jgi:hypothetical protein